MAASRDAHSICLACDLHWLAGGRLDSMGKRWRGRGAPGGTTLGQLDALAHACAQACATISQLGEDRPPALVASLASLRSAAASLVEAADAATSSSTAALGAKRVIASQPTMRLCSTTVIIPVLLAVVMLALIAGAVVAIELYNRD